MGRIEYNKLVRDRIPEIISDQGRNYSTQILSDADFELALREKLVEEAVEAMDADPDHLVVELADLQEVISYLMAIHHISHKAVNQEKQKRHQERKDLKSELMQKQRRWLEKAVYLAVVRKSAFHSRLYEYFYACYLNVHSEAPPNISTTNRASRWFDDHREIGGHDPNGTECPQ